MGNKADTQLIAKNTLLLYARMFFSMIVSLYTSRVVLNVLGVEDFGIYNVVGGVVAMFSFINGSMSGATSRFITYELGRGRTIALKETFSSALIVHCIIALVVLFISETIGLWFLKNKLVIPDTRMYAAECVFHLSVLASIIGILQVPYNACVIAHERMNVYAYIEMLNVALKLVVVFVLLVWNFDKLILYAWLVVMISAIILCIYVIYSRNAFEESRFKFIWRPRIIKSMLSFSGADLYGNASVILRQQGVNMILNIFCGTLVNAASSIATTVNAVTMNLVNNVSTAFRPQIIKRYASSDYAEMTHLMKMSAMICMMLFLTIAVPLIIEMEFVLSIWLGQVPMHSVAFCRILLIFSTCTVITAVLNIGIHATGKIYMISFISGTVIWLAVPVIYYFLYKGFDPKVAYVCNGIVSVLVLVINTLIFKYNVKQFSIRDFWFNGIFKSAFGCIMTALILYGIASKVDEDWIRLIILCGSSVFLNSIIAFIFIIDSNLRSVIMSKLGVSKRVSKFILNFLNRVSNRIEWEKTKIKFWMNKSLRNQIKVLDSDATIQHILDHNCSVSRYGDGEFDMIIHLLTDGAIPSLSGFQAYNELLARRLKEIIEEQDYNDMSHIVCVPYWYRSNNVGVYKPGVQRFCKKYLCEKLTYILSIINIDRTYYNANISRFYMSYKDKSGCLSYVRSLRRIWEGRCICFIEGEYSRMGVGNDLFQGAEKISRILCPAIDAYSKYDEILMTIKENVDCSTLLILALGHTATVLAYDLSKAGYQAIDLGHLDVEYEWMLQGVNEKVSLEHKYVNEVPDGATRTLCDNEEYKGQIITVIN